MKVRTLYRWLVPVLLLLACLAVILLFAPKRVQIRQAATALPAPPEPSAPFLQQPVPPGPGLRHTPPDEHGGVDPTPWLQYLSFADRLKDLDATVGRRLVYPEGFTEFIQTEDAKENWDKGPVLFILERDGVPLGPTMRDYLNSTLGGLTLTWKYDPTQDAILTDFQWHRGDPRSARELADTLARIRPPAYRELIRQSIGKKGTELDFPRASDPWLQAFDALLSKPENFSHVWKLRFIDDTRRYVAPTMVENILAKKMRDDHGRTHLIVINIQPVMINEQQGSFTYYLFDEVGTFEKGGLINGGQDFGEALASLDSEEMILTIRSSDNNVVTNEASYLLTGDGLVLKTLTKARYPEVVGQVLYQVKR